MKKVSIFGVGNIGVRVAYMLARGRDVAEIVLVDVDRKRSEATLLDFVQSNVALRSKIGFSSPVEPKEIIGSDVVIIAAGVKNGSGAKITQLDDATKKMLDEIGTQVGHFTPEATVAVVSQPAELICWYVRREGGFSPEKVIGFPLLTAREWFRDVLSRLAGVENSDIRITTLRTLEGEELVPEQTRVRGIPLTALVPNLSLIGEGPSEEETAKRLEHYHNSPAAVIAEVTMELVNHRRVVITAVAWSTEAKTYLEVKAVIGPDGVERIIPVQMSSDQQQRRHAYEQRVIELTRGL